MHVKKIIVPLLCSAVMLCSSATSIATTVSAKSNATSIGATGWQNPTHHQLVWHNRKLAREQAKYQNNKKIFVKVRAYLSGPMKKEIAKHRKMYHKHWYRDGLSNRQLHARDWVVAHESSFRWNVLSYGKVCIGYFQLNPGYLGYVHKHGHRTVNLNHKHQVEVADAYAKVRYGNWVKAKQFWQAHNWY